MNPTLDYCECGRRKRSTADHCAKCKAALGEYNTYDRDKVSLRDLIFGRIFDPVVAERHYQHAVAVQARVAGAASRDALGRTNHQARTK